MTPNEIAVNRIANYRGGILDLSGLAISELPHEIVTLSQRGIVSIDCSNCTALTSVPPEMKFGGYAYFNGCTSLTSIPAGMVFLKGAYFGGCTSLTSIPIGTIFTNCTCYY
jgi:hypothetical protein